MSCSPSMWEVSILIWVFLEQGSEKSAWSVTAEALSHSPAAFRSALQFTPVSLSGFL